MNNDRVITGKYKSTDTYPENRKGEFFMANCGSELSDNKHYYISSNVNELDAKEFSETVVELLNTNYKVDDLICTLGDLILSYKNPHNPSAFILEVERVINNYKKQ